MKKTIFIFTLIVVLTFGAATSVYADGYNNHCGGSRTNSYQRSNASYNSMIELMKNNGFEAAAIALENRDYKALDDFMDGLTKEQYNKMIELMNDYSYTGYNGMMGSYGNYWMYNMHNARFSR